MRASLCLFSTILSAASIINAAIYPVNPTGETVWKVGSRVEIEWSDNEDTPHLKDMMPFTVDLYTGLDQSQLKLENIATKVSGETRSVNYTVPDVIPYGKLYFLRFTVSNPKDPNAPLYYWTTRFTITNTDNTTPSPSTAAIGGLASSTSKSASTSSATTTESMSTSLSSSPDSHSSISSGIVSSSTDSHYSSSMSSISPTSDSSSSNSMASPSSSTNSSPVSTSTSTSISTSSADSSTSSTSTASQTEPTDHINSALTSAPTWSVILGALSFFLM
ncbi:hypothetical protein K7432_011796 [Basidiobolus ranarum]|uniref:Yeast cell wall synthesis Kre9/Knh1-like N-terminal domain-containing protein n=1 Tax=Basidiobolus ranarum TaxID=34480 RepID=A0ABR2VTA8_9FUNG